MQLAQIRLESPADRVESQGLRVAPQALGIVKTDSLYSGVLVFPKTPTSRKRHDSFRGRCARAREFKMARIEPTVTAAIT
jgi:hypothetical protein